MSQYLTATKCPCCTETLIVYVCVNDDSIVSEFKIQKYDESIDGKRKVSEIFEELDNKISQEGHNYFKKIKENGR